MEEQKASYPVAVFGLNESDPGYAQGARAIIMQVDGDQMFIGNLGRVTHLLAIHGMRAVSDEVMDRLQTQEEP